MTSIFSIIIRPKNSTLPLVKSPVVFNRPRGWRVVLPTVQSEGTNGKQFSNDKAKLSSDVSRNTRKVSGNSYFADDVASSSTCYETAFTSVEPQTRIIRQKCANILRRSRSSERFLDDDNPGTNLRPSEKDNIYRSLDRLRSKSGGYVNVAAFGSADCLDRMENNCLWYPADPSDSWTTHSRSISSLSCYPSAVTGLSPPSFSDFSSASSSRAGDYENLRHLPQFSQSSLGEESPSAEGLRLYRNSPSKRFIGRRKGLEFYYGVKACRPGELLPDFVFICLMFCCRDTDVFTRIGI